MPASARFLLRRVFAALALLATTSAAVSAASGTAEPWELCARHAVAAAAGENLPAHLLPAIAKVESGLWSKDRGELRAWPWTVTAEGKGRYLPTKAAAIAEVEALKARGIRSIDVGCLQVNLAYHPEAFLSLEEAFDPAVNAAYAARFLADLRREASSWTVAIGHYHSRTPTLSNRYRLKVSRAWRAERHAANRKPSKSGHRAAVSPERSQMRGPPPTEAPWHSHPTGGATLASACGRNNFRTDALAPGRKQGRDLAPISRPA